ncbi:hypothetical protein [Luteimonas saliphila]|uniref:hypothetical protein n=1 Tax=Luteimonas saliphila TaxID=2804919 RepID=UPI00192DC48D|nr:hypothetical protein [Luteimonas saliphila]
MKLRTDQEGRDAGSPETAPGVQPLVGVAAALGKPDVPRGELSTREATAGRIDTIRELEERLRRAYDELDAMHALRDRVRTLEARNASLREEHDRRCRELADLAVLMASGTSGAATGTQPSTQPFSAGRAKGFLARLSGRYHRFLFGRRKARIRRSGIFDARWYLERNPDVANSGLDPLDHYLLFGRLEGRQVSPYFDIVQYIAENPGALDDPLTHFLKQGRGGA